MPEADIKTSPFLGASAIPFRVKQKIKKEMWSDEEKATGVVRWVVKIRNQYEQVAANYDVMTLVERKE